MLIDVHAHFSQDRPPRADWRERNASRLRAGERIGVTIHVASVLGTWGRTSPVYFPSPPDLQYGNDALLALQRAHPDRMRGYVTVNPTSPPTPWAELTAVAAPALSGSSSPPAGRRTHPPPHPI